MPARDHRRRSSRCFTWSRLPPGGSRLGRRSEPANDGDPHARAVNGWA